MVGFNPSFRIQGQVYHLIGSIVPTQGESPKFAQIYFIDNEESEVATRSAIINGLKPDIIRGINQLLHQTNHYVELFKVAKEMFEQEDTPTNVRIKTHDSESRGQEEAGRTRRTSELFTRSTALKFVNALNKPP